MKEKIEELVGEDGKVKLSEFGLPINELLFKDILENIEDLDPEFSKLIDEHYWDLI